MFDHISIGVRDIARSKRFYDAALPPLGFRLLSEGESSLGFGIGRVSLWLLHTESPVPADPKSGLHFAFRAPDVRSVGEFYIAALDSGGSDNGALVVEQPRSDARHRAAEHHVRRQTEGFDGIAAQIDALTGAGKTIEISEAHGRPVYRTPRLPQAVRTSLPMPR